MGPRLLASIALFALLAATSLTPAQAEPWLCPDCLHEVIERPVGAADLSCPKCGITHGTIELAPPVAYVNSRTRDTEVSWVVQTENCELFRMDGLRVFDAQKRDLWVPWSAVDWFIPRMRLVHLTDGQEFATDYPKGATCAEPPRFAVELADSVVIPGQMPSIRRMTLEEDLAALFIWAASPEERDSARVRFLEEVETGKHPRLPRTPARLVRPAVVRSPGDVVSKSLKCEAVVDVRLHDRGGILRIKTVKSSGVASADAEAIRAAMSSGYQMGGEMGVAVPSSVRLKVIFDGKDARIETEELPRGMWDE
ncbi:MAG: hypothetical protein IT349_08285 [Candidatus Eisenbacteria bacterium]|nr:hypothetical protein [Candidatus Eisenbacteria bacterium]MCC7142082.1 hypothetical protein [Candidatus Eisenbacteria bacterium]